MLDDAKLASELSKKTGANASDPHAPRVVCNPDCHAPTLINTIAIANVNMSTETALLILSLIGSTVYFPPHAPLRNLVPPSAQYDWNTMSMNKISTERFAALMKKESTVVPAFVFWPSGYWGGC